jgi:hypothetical protein
LVSRVEIEREERKGREGREENGEPECGETV